MRKINAKKIATLIFACPLILMAANEAILKREKSSATVFVGPISYTLFRDTNESTDQFINGKNVRVRTSTKSKILSEVSYVVSVKTTSTSTIPYQGCCGSTVTAQDIRKKGARASLLNWFSERAVVEALSKDAWLKQRVKRPSDLNIIANSNTLNPLVCRSALEYSFSFHHVRKDSVAIRLHLPKECFGESVQLGFYLQIPDSLKSAFSIASAEKKLSGP